MIIPLTEELRIETTTVPSFIIQRRCIRGQKTKSPGEVYWKDLAFLGSLSKALIRAVDFMAADDYGTPTLRELSRKIEKWQRDIREAADL